MIRVIEQADARKQQSAQAIPKRGTGFQPVENMAKMAMPLNQAIRQAVKKGNLKKQSVRQAKLVRFSRF